MLGVRPYFLRCLFLVIGATSLIIARQVLASRQNANGIGATSYSAADDSDANVKPNPKRAKQLTELGARKERDGAYEEALAAYEQASRYAPFDVTIAGKAAALRSKLVQSFVNRAEQLAAGGHLLEATQQLAAALRIDPHNELLLERLKQISAMLTESKHSAQQEPSARLAQVVPEKETKNFRFHTDLQSAYLQVAAAFGLKATFDPDLPARGVELRLENVDFDTAMTVLTLVTGTFWKALNSKTIFVAGDTPEKHKAFDTVVEQTFELPQSVTPTEVTELVHAVRDLTGSQRVEPSVSTHSLTIRDTLPRVRLAGAIIQDLEQARGEVLLEMDFLEVDRNNARKLGITPPSNLTAYYLSPTILQELSAATTYSAALTILESVLGLSSSSSIPSYVGFGGGTSTFLLTLPNVAADFSQSLSLVHSGRQVLLRAQDGKPATFFVGERYPITLSLLSSSLSSSTSTASVGGSSSNLQTEQFTVGQNPVAMGAADFRSLGLQDLAVLNQADDSITVLLNQGTGVSTQFVQASGSPISLSTGSTKSSVASAAVPLVVTSATLQSISVAPTRVSLALYGTQQFVATGIFSDGSRQDITSDVSWASSNAAIATISSQTGIASAQGSGATYISATLGSVASTAAILTGTSATLRSIAITPAAASIARDSTQQFTATGTFSDGSKQDVTTSVTWSISNDNVATVRTASGLSRGLAVGSAQIQAALGTTHSANAVLTVTSATLLSIAVTPTSATIAAGTSQRYTATGSYSDRSKQVLSSVVSWASSNTAVAAMEGSSGRATGKSAGTTSITATQGGLGTPVAIAAGSLNSNTDAYPDLVVASQTTNTVTVLLGNGDGTFTSPSSAVRYAVGNRPSAIALGTFNTNTNSYLGFVVTNFADNSYSVFTGNGDGTFTEVNGSPFALPSGQRGPAAITVNDFNQDGIPDLAIVNETTNNITILEGNGDGIFKLFSSTSLSTGNYPVAIASGTLDGSTGPALAVANQNDNSVSVFLGNGDGTFSAASQSPLAVGSAPSGIAVADFANTSTGGIAVTNRDSGTVTAFLDEGSGSFTQVLNTSAGTNPGAILVGDFTGSTYPDVAITNDITGSDGVVVLFVSPASYISGLSSGQTAYPGAQYEDIGIKVKATPFLHPDDEVTLQMEYEIRALSGSNINGIPIISNESVTQTIRLKEGETSIITGLIDREESKALTGIPGLANMPFGGYLFGSRNSSATDDELLILITPRRVSAPVHKSRDVYAGRGDTAGRDSAASDNSAAPSPNPGTSEPQPPRDHPPVAPPPGAPQPSPDNLPETIEPPHRADP
jgi:type II secretory pathway component GspD/PulD (secretin)